MLLTVLAPILTTVPTSGAVRVVVEASVLLLLVQSGSTLLLRSGSSLSSWSASLALGRLRFETIVRGSGLRTRSSGRSSGRSVRAQKVVETAGRSLRLVRLGSLGLLSPLELGLAVTTRTKGRLVIKAR